MNIFLHELKAYRKSTVIWTCSLSAVIVFFLSLFPAFSRDAADFQRLIEGFPEIVRKAVGLNMDISSFLNYYIYAFSYMVLCGAIQAMNLGLSILSKEVKDKTAEFLLTKPVKRSQVLTSKLLSVLTSLFFTNAVYLIVSLIMGLLVKDKPFSIKLFLMINITMIFVQLIFMALGVIVSVIAPKIKSVISLSLSTVFGFFFLNMFGSVIGDKKIRYITPFKYFDYMYIIDKGSYEAAYVILGILFIIFAIIASYIIYSKKDIHSI